MKVYLAASFPRLREMRERRADLEKRGHTVTSRWLDHDPDTNYENIPEHAQQRRAWEDWEDVRASNCFIMFTESPPLSRGGRHTELGLALGLGKQVVIIGPKENVFHHLLCIRHFDRWEDVRF